jgi:anti-sigma B factor antagonist
MKQFTISERIVGDIVFLDLTGDLIFGEANKALRKTIRDLIDMGKVKIVLNLRDVAYLDSSGIGELISALTAINREEDGGLRILNPSDRIQYLFAISKLEDIFDIDYDENLAAAV